MGDTPYAKEGEGADAVAVPIPVAHEDPYANYEGSGAEDAGSGMGASADSLLRMLGGKLMGIALMSCVLLIQTSIDCDNFGYNNGNEFTTKGCKEETAYAVSVATISLVICLIYLATLKFSPEKVPEKTLFFLSIFLFVWWAIAAGVLTFDAPYTVTSNAYFAIWSATIFSALLCMTEVEQFRVFVGRMQEFHGNSNAIATLLLCSVVELAASIKPCCGNGKASFAVALGAVSVFFCLLVVFIRGVQGMSRFVALFLGVWWFIGGCVVTFGDGPFVVTGNGWFATWGAVISSLLLLESEGGVPEMPSQQ